MNENIQIDRTLFSDEVRSESVVWGIQKTAVLLANFVAEVSQQLPEKDLAPFRERAADAVDFLGIVIDILGVETEVASVGEPIAPEELKPNAPEEPKPVPQKQSKTPASRPVKTAPPAARQTAIEDILANAEDYLAKIGGDEEKNAPVENNPTPKRKVRERASKDLFPMEPFPKEPTVPEEPQDLTPSEPEQDIPWALPNECDAEPINEIQTHIVSRQLPIRLTEKIPLIDPLKYNALLGHELVKKLKLKGLSEYGTASILVALWGGKEAS